MIESGIDEIERKPEQPAGGLKCRFDHILEMEMRLDLGLVEIVTRLSELFRVVAPVVWCERKVSAFFGNHRLQRVPLDRRLCERPAPDLIKQLADRLRR